MNMDDDDDAEFLADVAAYLEPLELLPALSGGVSDTEGSESTAATASTTRSQADTLHEALELEASQQHERPPPRNKPSTTRNVTRERRRRELQELRTQCAELERQLEALQTIAQREPALAAKSRLLLTAWRGVAQQQRARRVCAELENARLKQTLAQHEAMAQCLHTLMQQWSAAVAPSPLIRSRATAAKPTRVAMQPFASIDAADVVIYRQLLAELDCEHARMDRVLAENGLIYWKTSARASTAQMKARSSGGGAYMELLEIDTLPFAAETVSRVSWLCWQRRELPRTNPVYNHLALADGATLVAKLGYDVAVDGESVALELLCVLRAYVERGRASTVLRGITRADAHFPGVYIDETDWQLMVPIAASGDGGDCDRDGGRGAATAFYSCAHMEAKRFARGGNLAGAGAGSNYSLDDNHASPFARLTATTYEVDMDEICHRMTSMLRHGGGGNGGCESPAPLPSTMAAAYVRHL